MRGGCIFVALVASAGCGGAVAVDADTGAIASADAGTVVVDDAGATSIPPQDAAPPPASSYTSIDARCAPASSYRGDYVTPTWVLGTPPSPLTGGFITEGRWDLVSETRYQPAGPANPTKPSLADRKTVLIVGTAKMRVDSRYRRVTDGFTIEEVDEWVVGGYFRSGSSTGSDFGPIVECASNVDEPTFLGGPYSVTGDTLVVQSQCRACAYRGELTFRHE